MLTENASLQKQYFGDRQSLLVTNHKKPKKEKMRKCDNNKRRLKELNRLRSNPFFRQPRDGDHSQGRAGFG